MVRANEPYRESAGQSRSFGPLKIRFLVGWYAVSVVYGTLSAERNVSVVRSIRPWQTMADRGRPWQTMERSFGFHGVEILCG